MKRVAIIDYGMGNLVSVVNAVNALGVEALVADSPADLGRASHIVLPGVGAFADAMRNLGDRGWIPALEEAALGQGKPFLGICLGMQLLAATGMEHGEHKGLGWIKGRVERLVPQGEGLRVPHVGWNAVHPVPGAGDGLFHGLADGEDFYFVHSYAFVPEDPAHCAAVCDHGGLFCAAVASGRVFGTQFHPEKSQRAGWRVLANFLG
ncbi:MAG TPA: imidazole glycerol phosphate synthase subunit HisH [Solidesulfovibrio magneticus]|nr:imidazole glycerol phosphate synthase subunit HisH [Solidesulfovibrio magneticus]